MTEALWGVIIGGAVGVVGGMIGTIVQHHYAGKRWKKKAQLERLQRERDRMEEKFFDFVKRVRMAILFPSGQGFTTQAEAGDLLAFMTLYFPKVLTRLPSLYHAGALPMKSLSAEEFGPVMDVIEVEMRDYLAAMDAKIDALLS